MKFTLLSATLLLTVTAFAQTAKPAAAVKQRVSAESTELLVIALAAFFGAARLIDNIELKYAALSCIPPLARGPRPRPFHYWIK